MAEVFQPVNEHLGLGAAASLLQWCPRRQHRHLPPEVACHLRCRETCAPLRPEAFASCVRGCRACEHVARELPFRLWWGARPRPHARAAWCPRCWGRLRARRGRIARGYDETSEGASGRCYAANKMRPVE